MGASWAVSLPRPSRSTSTSRVLFSSAAFPTIVQNVLYDRLSSHQPRQPEKGRPSMATTIPTRRPTQPPLIDQLRILYLDQQLTDDDIAAHYGVSTRTVTAWLRNAGIHRPRPSSWVASVPAQHLRELYLDQRQIAAHQRVTETTVWRALKYHQIPRRPAGRQVSPPPQAAELRRLYLQERWSIRQLAARYRVSYPTMRYRLG